MECQLCHYYLSVVAENKKNLEIWQQAVADFDALVSLATYSFNHPDYVFPTPEEQFVFEGKALAHPLIKADVVVKRCEYSSRIVLFGGDRGKYGRKKHFFTYRRCKSCVMYRNGCLCRIADFILNIWSLICEQLIRSTTTDRISLQN